MKALKMLEMSEYESYFPRKPCHHIQLVGNIKNTTCTVHYSYNNIQGTAAFAVLIWGGFNIKNANIHKNSLWVKLCSSGSCGDFELWVCLHIRKIVITGCGWSNNFLTDWLSFGCYVEPKNFKPKFKMQVPCIDCIALHCLLMSLRYIDL